MLWLITVSNSEANNFTTFTAVQKFRYFLFILAVIISVTASAQSKAKVEGTIRDAKGEAVEAATISILGLAGGEVSNEKGYFKIDVPAEQAFTLIVSHISFEDYRQDFTLKAGEKRKLKIELVENAVKLTPFTLEAEEDREKTMSKIDPKVLQYIPNSSGNFETVIKTQIGVSSSNELTSQYNVRGGNYDENLIYVNDIQIYRPFLVRSGQQEGLSFINSDMVSSISFSAGGFEARYGDKLSSVLAVDYKEPEKFAGTVTGSLQGGALTLEGASDNRRFTALTGFRYRSNAYILSSLDTDGDYRPNFTDIQTYLTYDVSDSWEIGFLGNYSRNRYEFIPETRQTDFGTIQQALRLTVFFEGQEVDSYETWFGAITNKFKPRNDMELKFITSGYRSFEEETFDILGQYFIDELERDLGSDNFGDVAFNRGVGSFLDHARNYLDVTVVNTEHRGKWLRENGSYEWGLKYQYEEIDDELSEWNLIDSAGFSKPQPSQNPGQTPVRPIPLNLFEVFKAENFLTSNRISGYAQRTLNWMDADSGRFSVTAGVRANYWSLNQQTVISPRANIAYEPNWTRDFLFRLSGGWYYQPPFYRELRNFNGELNRDLRAQRSIHLVLGTDYNFKAWGRQFKLVGEAYYKDMNQIIPYEIDNVRIRYYAENNANAYAVGADVKINGEFVKGVESWVSLGFLQVEEDIKDDFYFDYFNSEGERIIPGFTFNDTPVDSNRVEPGYIPRPTDQRINFSLFFQDYLPQNPTIKLHMTFHYGSGLPFGPPDRTRYRDTLRIPSYLRVDVGMSKQLLDENTKLKEGSAFRHLKSVWLGVDVFNLLQRNNTLSYLWVTDVTGRQYAVPNFLTSRQVNLRLQVKF